MAASRDRDRPPPETCHDRRAQGPAMAVRRCLYLALVLACAAVPLALLGRALGAGGWTVAEGLIWALALVVSPWIATLGASALVGFAVLMAGRDPLAVVWPEARLDPDRPIGIRTAILLCIRNEDTRAVLARIRPLLFALDAQGVGERFALFVLSDTRDPAHAAEEEAAFAAFRATLPWPDRTAYRRRESNEGFKAGNVMEFVRARSAGFEAMITLDADSVMTADAVLRLVRLIEQNPRVALIQTLIAAQPTAAAFPRLFQFGMRHGMRAYAAGIAWWQGADGPYWGHNAIIRIAPFRDHAALPALPDGASILSHDQVEAALLRGAGWEVRLDPLEQGSYEANPPSLLAFMRRDLRWMAGNLQYLALLRLPLFSWMGRVQLVLAILLFLWSPVVVAIALAALANALDADPRAAVALGPGLAATALFALLFFAPKLLGALEVALKPALRRRWGGGATLAAGVAAEFLFYLLLVPLSALNQTVGMAGLALGRRIGWAPQTREDRRVPLADAARALWWHTLAGVGLLAGFALAGTTAFLWALPFLAGAALAIPYCVLTADPAFGRRLAAARLAAIPEELDPASPFPPLLSAPARAA
ncbi:glucans biosynthesis glucosyltransferase MdoH [Elioraea sp.]|uniref:glucans biosynthesis glucosyltransferase MdoH n=1 Tax=Elioraea sp. TaxID=2185103 RepID=UPI00260FA7E1|nr:glucans biosynthesis glucosyltransferase MdoH [Elioraea sp.]